MFTNKMKCPTEVDDSGTMRNVGDVFYGTGFCDDSCPRDVNSTWGVDETLRVTTHFFFDPEIYMAIVGLGIMTTSLIIIAAGLKCFGI